MPAAVAQLQFDAMRVERTAGRHREAVQRLAAVDRQAIHDAAADTAAFQCQAPGQLRAAVVRHGFAAEPQAGGVAIDMAVGSVLSAVVLDVGGALVKLPAQCAHFPSRSEEHTSELQSLMRISYAVFC